jgi:hypothetical protein
MVVLSTHLNNQTASFMRLPRSEVILMGLLWACWACIKALPIRNPSNKPIKDPNVMGGGVVKIK